MMAHAIRSYYGSTQLLEADHEPIWIVNEGEYRMMNTFDLTVDQLFYEMKMNPWTVKNELDLFMDRYSYRDTVRFPGGARNTTAASASPMTWEWPIRSRVLAIRPMSSSA